MSRLKKQVGDIAWLSESSFNRGLSAAAYGLWSGKMDMTDFLDAIFSLVEIEYTLAWHEGMRAAGLKPSDMSEDEATALSNHIVQAEGHAFDFGLFIQDHSKAAGHQFNEIDGRRGGWLTGYNTVYNEALTFAANDPNLEWVLGPTEQHCDSCSKLNGKIKRASVWDASMIQPSNPPNPYLICGGWRCACYFEVTQSAQSRGPLPILRMPVTRS